MGYMFRYKWGTFPPLLEEEMCRPYQECKFLCWKGGVLQKCANTTVYTVIYGIIGLAHAAVSSYQVGIISTVEKRFKIPSKVSGLIISGWDIGTCFCVIFLLFYGNKVHRPQAVTFGMFLVATSCILWLLPHAIYGMGHLEVIDNNSPELSRCELGDLTSEICTKGDASILSSLIFTTGNIIFGCGTCFYWTLGLAYMDDNSRKNKTPILLASTMLIRMLGPTCGFMLASYSLSTPVDLARASEMKSNDPRWIGAWWLGFIPLCIIILFLSFLMRGFPRQLPGAFNRKVASRSLPIVETSVPTLKGFRLMVNRLLNNKIFLYNTISSTLYVFGMMGFGTFGPKYLEAQFQKSPSEASFIIGTVGLVCTGLGFFTSGIVITYFRPNPRLLALWNVIAESLDVLGQIVFAFLGCPINNLHGHWVNSQWMLQEECNEFCSCPLAIKYSPVCTQSGTELFYSPCHAGCSFGSYNESLKAYEGCICVPENLVVNGPCSVSDECDYEFYVYLAVLSILKFFSASGRAGNTILQFRSVSEEDKAISIGVTEGFMSIFAFIPSPIFFGVLLDSTCLIWGESCGKKGHCWLYNGQSMRYYLNFTTSGFLILATLADIAVWFHSNSLNIYDEGKDLNQELKTSETDKDVHSLTDFNSK